MTSTRFVIGESLMKTSWVWLGIGITGLAGHQQADVLLPSSEGQTPGSSLAPSDLIRPSLRTESDSALELTEIATYTLPPGMAVAGAALSPDGARLVVWGSQPKSVLYFERGVEGVQSVSPEHLPPGEIAGVAFLEDATLGIIHAGGRVSTAEWGNWTHHTRRVIPVSGIRSAALGDDGWWLLAEYCYNCKLWIPEQGPEPEEDHFACRATEELGYQACELSDGGRKCNHSNRPDGSFDCLIVLDPAGRVYSAELPRRMQEEAPAVNVLPEVVRHECTGAIVRRRYSPARIAELRSDLRNVTI